MDRSGAIGRVGLASAWICLLFVGIGALAVPIQAQPGVVHAILFYSPACTHCHKVITEDLPPLREKYGDRLIIVELDTTEGQNGVLFQAAMELHQPELKGVPALVIGDTMLVGSVDIPDQLPGLIETYLAKGGVDWPDLPGIEEIILDSEAPVQKFARDPLGNSLSIMVLVGMVVMGGLVIIPRRWHAPFAQRFAPWGIVLFIVIGLVAAAYLSYVEVTQSEAVCGPVGDCNAVQQSQYAKLFGVLPVAVLGLIGYIMLAITYSYGEWIKGPNAEFAPAIVFLMALGGLAFSIYLTFLEPFVIGATCMWCLTSSVSMALIALLSAGAGWPAIYTGLRQLGFRVKLPQALRPARMTAKSRKRRKHK
ncbi:MAG: vitamin K epoxide reductase [Anaerolineae bacterium]|nr:vitamin K epoxide reductase [Anaerolineae bacterium]